MRLRAVWAPLAACLMLLSANFAQAQGPKPRLATAIEAGGRVELAGTRPRQASFGVDQGALSPATALKGVNLVLSRSAAQQADLDALLEAQQNTASPLYHQWLTPDQFAARFGVADADLAKIEAWLQSQGFQIFSVSRSRNRIVFDGNVGQVNAAFGTELHRYAFADRVHFAPNSNLSVPAALAPMVEAVTRLSDFRPHRMLKLAPRAVSKPAYTSSVSPGNHFLTPLDLATMYDVNPIYKAGFNGAGQSIAILGQSFVTTAPITQFQAGAGLTAKLPTMVLVPDTGVNGINFVEDGDEGESQLDLEYSSGMAPGANILFVYTGDNTTAGVFDSLTYAIDGAVAPVISGSYGLCELEFQTAPANANAINLEIQQASAQGQTVLFSSGDSGSTDCYGDTNLNTTQQGALAVDFPASIPNVTAIGGTQMATGTYTAGTSQYWQSATGTDVIGSLLSYVPETVWNEDTNPNVDTVAAGGGGVSVLFSRPSWQAGVPGIAAGANRLVPDVAFQSSINSPGFIYCTSDPSDLSGESLTDSCSNGLRSSAGTFLVAGGTSFATPAFAGLIAVLNQAKHAAGQGNINPTLYALASNATTYSSVFHDISNGTNACTLGPTVCTTAGASAYAAGAGYDEATGLGSIDFANMVAAWPSSTASSLALSSVSVQPATTTPAAGATDQVTITVAAQGTGSGATPTGSVTIVVDGTPVAPALALANGTATYTYTAPATGLGSHTVAAVYSGDAIYAASRGVAVVTVGNATPSGSFTVTAQPLTVAYNSVASSQFVLTPASGYTGTVVLSLNYAGNTPTICYDLSNSNSSGFNVPLNGGTAVTGTLTIGEGTQCTTSATGAVVLRKGGPVARAEKPAGLPAAPARRWPSGVAFAGLLLAGIATRRRARRVPVLLSLAALAMLGVGISGCGGSTTGLPTRPNQPQTVTVTLSGVDSVNSSISNSTNFTLTIQ